MASTIFDAIDEPRTDTIFDLAEKVTPVDVQDDTVPFYKSIPSALGKGLIQGLGALGRVMGPLQEHYDPEEVKRTLDELLPSEEGFIEGTLERAGKTFPLVASGGGGAGAALARTGVSALAGESAKKLGASESTQSIAEVATLIAPDIKKLIKAGKSVKEIVDFARSKGLSEKEIAPLIQSSKKQRALGKIAFKRGSQDRLSKSKDAVGRIYQDLYKNPSAKKILSNVEASKTISSIEDKLLKMPRKISQTIEADLQDLRNSPKAAEDFMNFYADINSTLSGNKKQISLLKDPVVKAIDSIDKSLGSDFRKTNDLYKSWAEISKTLKPTLASDIFEGSIPLRVGLGIKFPPVLGEVLLESSGKKLATELLLNPRLQNLGSKMARAINDNKFAIAEKTWNEIINSVDKKDKKAANKLKDLDFLSQIASIEYSETE